VTMLRANGVKLQTAKELAGHHTERMTEHYTHEDGSAVLALPDFSTQQAQGAANVPAVIPFTVAPQAEPNGGAAVAARPAAARLSFDELKAAFAGLTKKQRGELLRVIGGAN